jgi:hypothetical protein
MEQFMTNCQISGAGISFLRALGERGPWSQEEFMTKVEAG